MTYFIFLKYLNSLEDFRKNPHIKIPPKSPTTNFQSLGIFKKQIFIQKRFFLTFGPAASQPIRPFGPVARQPIQPFGPPGPTGRLLPPPAPEQSAQATAADQPRAAPMVGPDYLHRRENNCRITPPSFPQLSSALPPLQSPVTGAFNTGH
jgi:hypothetical protein